MGATISRKLSNSFEGALAGGGDPATSPLYVFGPFLKLIVIAGVAQVTFGATVWLAVFTVIMVSAMYRQVMRWVTDGSGGSGLSEEEFGGWAVKINAGITVIEYTLTFLVSMAALVTFIADRLPALNGTIGGWQYRTFLAIALSILTGWLVNRGPKVSARAFGPATAAILALLWVMIFATIYKQGFHLPDFNLQAFSFDPVNYVAENGEAVKSSYFHLTLGGYARILALMTGIEIFANLVAAYEGKRAERSRKAFGSLIIIMGTTALTMLIVGPAIFADSDPLNSHVSVFTQTMDFLLPAWASYAGTFIGIAVLLSACAAAAQGIQNLALGLRYRHYVSAAFGQRNKHDVADYPVWLMIGVIGLSFLLFGTHEETYLALYAAGVFILLSMTGWAASKRLFREMRERFGIGKLFSLLGTAIAALLTSFATFIIFEERFFEGAWAYLILVPLLYVGFTYYRNKLGKPPSVEDRLGSIISEQRYLPLTLQKTAPGEIAFDNIIVPLSGNSLAEQVLPIARAFARSYGSTLKLIAIDEKDKYDETDQTEYLEMVSGLINSDGLESDIEIRKGDPSTGIDSYAQETGADLIIMTTRGKFSVDSIMTDSIAQRVIKKTLTPTLLIRPTDNWRSRRSKFKRILVALDGSEAAEKVLPYIRKFANEFGSKVLLFSVPEGSESENYSERIQQYLDDIAETLKEEGIDVITLVAGSGPARTIVALSEEENVDLIMMASHGRGGTERANIHLGSVTDRVVQKTPCPVFIVPLTRSEK
ncbi:MAG: universal stress protein [Pyrinomonadaceae bacterium]|nr:universal stress protein [Pyrinomonadaceae bacterium]